MWCDSEGRTTEERLLLLAQWEIKTQKALRAKMPLPISPEICDLLLGLQLVVNEDLKGLRVFYPGGSWKSHSQYQEESRMNKLRFTKEIKVIERGSHKLEVSGNGFGHRRYLLWQDQKVLVDKVIDA